MINSEGITSNELSAHSMVRHSASPQTEQHELLELCAPSHSSRGLSAIQIRLDWDGSCWKEALSIALDSSLGLMPRGGKTSSNVAIAFSSASRVPSHRGQVCPLGSTSLCHKIGNVFTCGSSSSPKLMSNDRAKADFCGSLD